MKLIANISFCIYLFFTYSNFDLSAKENGSIKSQVEVSLDLTGKAAKRILTHYEFQPKKRTDYVFDIYDGNQFLLFPGSQKIRFRLKEEENKRLLQINLNTNTYSRICENKIHILIRERKSGEIKTNPESYYELIKGNNLIQSIKNDPSKTIKPIVDFNQYLKELKIPLKSNIEKNIQTKTWIYTPINITKKTKWKIKKDFGYGQIIISISQGKDFIGNEFIQDKWELEFQVNPLEWNEKGCNEKYCGIEKSVCQFLKTEEILIKDINPPKISPYLKVAELFSPHKKELGF